MKRKVVKHGPSTYVISLPSEWVKKYEIEKGDELEVEEKEKRLVISKTKHVVKKETEIDISNLDRTTIMYTIRSLYRLGYDNIKIRFDNKKTKYRDTEINVISAIHTETNRLIGFEIMEEHEHSCVIRDLQTTNPSEFEQILRKLFLMLNNTFEEFHEGLEKKSTLETIEEKHDTITKFVSYALRILNRHGHYEEIKTNYYYHIIATLDRIMDIIKYASRNILKYEIDLTNSEIVDIVKKNFRLYSELFYKFDNETIKKMNHNRYIADELLQNVKDSKKMMVLSSLSQILEMLLDLIEARTAIQY